eukprot:scaffold78040_cov49-Cyclotella_meneghiniana.AAC.8
MHKWTPLPHLQCVLFECIMPFDEEGCNTSCLNLCPGSVVFLTWASSAVIAVFAAMPLCGLGLARSTINAIKSRVGAHMI